MKSILMSIRPQWVAKILNGEKTIEIRKKFPKDYVGWVYIYCTKGKPRAILTDKGVIVANTLTVGGNSQYKSGYSLSGRVVARFWCDKVEEIESCQVPFTYEQWFTEYWTKTFSDMEDLLKASCLDYYTLDQYLEYSKNGYAIHITKLEIFDEPKEISEFYKANKDMEYINAVWENYGMPDKDDYDEVKLTRAPQNYCYVEL